MSMIPFLHFIPTGLESVGVHAVCAHTSLYSLAGNLSVNMDKITLAPRGQSEGLYVLGSDPTLYTLRKLAAYANITTSIRSSVHVQSCK